MREEDGRQAEGKTKRLQFFPLSSLLPSFTLAAASAQGRPSSSSPLFSSSSFSSALLERGEGARRGIAGLRGAQRRRRGRFFRRIEGTRAEAKKNERERSRGMGSTLRFFGSSRTRENCSFFSLCFFPLLSRSSLTRSALLSSTGRETARYRERRRNRHNKSRATKKQIYRFFAI